MKQTLKEVVKEKCFNCHDKGEVVIENKESHHKLVKIPCPVCTNKGKDAILGLSDKCFPCGNNRRLFNEITDIETLLFAGVS